MSVRSFLSSVAIATMSLVAASCSLTGHDGRFPVAQVQVATQRVELAAKDVAQGDAAAFQVLQKATDELASSMGRLRAESRSNATLSRYLGDFEKAGKKVSSDAARLMRFQEKFDEAKANMVEINMLVPILNSRTDEAINALAGDGSARKQSQIAFRTILLAQRMQRTAEDMSKGADPSAGLVDRLTRDSRLYGAMLAGLTKGNADLGIEPVTEVQAKGILVDAEKRWTDKQKVIEALLSADSDLQDMRQLTAQLQVESEQFVAVAENFLSGIE